MTICEGTIFTLFLSEVMVLIGNNIWMIRTNRALLLRQLWLLTALHACHARPGPGAVPPVSFTV